MTALQLLIADEQHLTQRKTNIARFGSTWIRPPGISKTKQAMDDEEAELREQELAMQREAALAEERAAAERAQRSPGGGIGLDAAMDTDVPAQEDRDPEAERDLDAEVPEAEEMESEGDFEPEEEEEEGADTREVEVEDIDLDEDIPEAGSYEHTDTELESSDVDDSRVSAALPPVGLATSRPPTQLDEHRLTTLSGTFPGTPASLGLDSSLLLSSPGAARGQRRGQPRRG